MRLKIIAGNLIVVLVVGLVSYFYVKSNLEAQLEAELHSRIAKDQTLFDRSFRLSGIEFLHRVSDQAATPDVRSVFGGLDETSRRRRGYEASERVSQWFNNPARGRVGAPDIVLITDDTGKVLARSQDVNRMYGYNLAQTLPSVRQTLQDGDPRHDVWKKSDENKLLQTAIAPIRTESGTIIGSLVVAYDLSNGLAQSEAAVLGRDVAFITDSAVYSSSLPGSTLGPLKTDLFGPRAAATKAALAGSVSEAWRGTLGGSEYVGVTAPLPMAPSVQAGYVVLANETERVATADVANVILLLLILGAVGVVVYGFLIGTSFLRPVEQIEEGVLAVINGNTDLRLDVQSAEFGGLAYRINQLINVFTGVAEEDEEGRVSAIPGPSTGSSGSGSWEGAAFQEAGSGTAATSGAGGATDVIDDPEVAKRLAAEPDDAYHARLYQEYVAAKKSVGEDVSNIPQDRFVQRLQGNGQTLAQKHGCRMVRFQVQTRGNQVILRPVLIR
jgi:hypothetical protein